MPSPPTFNFLNTVKLRSVSTFQTLDHLSTTDVRSGLRKVDSSASHVIQSNTPHVFIGEGGVAGGATVADGIVKGMAKWASKGLISIENVIFFALKILNC
jgi:hypothetical protein